MGEEAAQNRLASGARGARPRTRRARVPSSLHGRFPILPRSYVPRERLWQRLDAAAEGPATLVVAPTGSGKTLGVAGWLHARGRVADAVWVTATPDLDAPRLRALLDELDGRPEQVLVVDDAHRLPPDSMAHLDQQLGDDPESLRVVLLSRWDLPLTRLVPELLGHLTVLRGGVLRLDDDEVAALVHEHARTDADDVVGPIRHVAQGWCAVVVLAAKAVGADRDPAAAALRLMNGSPTVADRIMSEVFAAMTSRQRHLLLCAVAEPRVTARLARHLSRDANAEQTLDELESTGLLVTRHEPSDGSAAGLESAYDIHPLLREIVQRRIRLGGVDVERARASVRRAVAADVSQGDVSDAFRRLDAMDAADDVVALLAVHGVDLVLEGHLAGLRDFLRRHADLVAQRPACWLPIAFERWRAGDLVGARLWLERIVDAPARSLSGPDGGGQLPSLAPTCARLMLARIDVGEPAEAVKRIEADLSEQGRHVLGGTLAQLATFHLGVLEIRLGRLRDAERHLGAVAAHCRTSGPEQVGVAATAQLAVTQFLLGREHAALELAEGAARQLRSTPQRVGLGRARRTVEVVRGLAVIQRVLEPGRAVAEDEDLEEQPTFDGTDPVVATLHRVLRARSYLLRGAVARAERALTGDVAVEDLPAPLVPLVAFEEALQAVLGSDWNRLSRLEELLANRGAAAEATLVAGLRADGLDDTRAATELYAAAAAQARTLQPPTAAMALTCRAQLLAADGRDEEAMEHLAAAVTATQGRRNALPFLGWSRHGTPVSTLFQRLTERFSSDWSRQLAAGTAAVPGGLASAAAPLTATPRERSHVPDGVMRPSLSPRERDVLHELARGSTYADIAANLYVSENTVKTHVSSLYAKLAVSRRSDALAVARTLRLL